VRDWVQVKLDGRITLRAVEDALRSHGVDKLGLDALDRKVISVIHESFNGGPVGIEAITATLNEQVDTIVDVVEPYLLKIGFLKRSPRGRMLTKKAYEALGLKKETQEEMF
jgi:Holliday junction DNA helicase RuvB